MQISTYSAKLGYPVHEAYDETLGEDIRVTVLAAGVR